MHELGRTLIFLGAFLIIAGVILLAFTGFNVPLGRLPGDLSWHGRRWSVYFPIATSIVLSVLLSFLLWAISRLRR
jgi:hypothetical protein